MKNKNTSQPPDKNMRNINNKSIQVASFVYWCHKNKRK
jgi:hypothetical protein